jgi:hypothetical protein
MIKMLVITAQVKDVMYLGANNFYKLLSFFALEMLVNSCAK